MDLTHTRIVTELFYTRAVPALVREVAGVLAPHGIPIMPLKGALLQRWVYGARAFRALSDVDLLVPPAHFDQTRAALRGAGFSVEREEPGGWEVAMRRPQGLLEIDLHRRLSSTVRSSLHAEALFARGSRDTALFGAEVVLPDPRDLYAHLLLHLTLNWLTRGRLHHPEDLEAVPEALALAPDALARHLVDVDLGAHAALILPQVCVATRGPFTPRLQAALSLNRRARLVATAARLIAKGAGPGTLARRAIGILLAPSWLVAGREAIAKRLAV